VQSGFMPSHWISDHRKIMESIHNRQGWLTWCRT
jgi:hypothetical protein